jgi:DNA-binding transcriptional MerR regulator
VEDDDDPVLSIGELARRTGLPVRTIRFWSDIGVVPPAARTGSGRRLYDAACVARLELVATVRDLGLSLADVRRVVVAGQVSVAEVAAVHLDALDAQIRALRLHRSVLAVVVKRAAGNEEMTLMSKLAQMSVAERRQMIDDFLAEVFEGADPSPAFAPRWNAAPNLPDDPSPEQVDAWVELAELVSDPDFRQRVRQVTDVSVRIEASDGLRDWLGWVHDNAVAAVLRGCPPDSAEAAQVAAHGHHQRMAAVPVLPSRKRVAARRAARSSLRAAGIALGGAPQQHGTFGDVPGQRRRPPELRRRLRVPAEPRQQIPAHARQIVISRQRRLIS